MYLTYEEYTNMGGTLDETTFNDFEFQSEALINWYTFNRLKVNTTYPEEVKRLMKFLIDMAQKQASALNLGGTLASSDGTGTYITQQSNDGVSVSYNGMNAADLFDICHSRMLRAIPIYLNGVVNELGRYLLYRGLYDGE